MATLTKEDKIAAKLALQELRIQKQIAQKEKLSLELQAAKQRATGVEESQIQM